MDAESGNSVTEGQERKGENKNVLTYFTSMLVPARTGFTVCSNQEGHGENPEVILYYLNSLPGVGEGSLFQGEGLPPGHGCRWHFTCESPSFVHSVINIVVVPVHFLILLLFPVNSTSLNLWSLPFVAPAPLSSSRHWSRGEGASSARFSWEHHTGEYHS